MMDSYATLLVRLRLLRRDMMLSAAVGEAGGGADLFLVMATSTWPVPFER